MLGWGSGFLPFRRPAILRLSLQVPLTPLFATHPKSRLLSPLFATHFQKNFKAAIRTTDSAAGRSLLPARFRLLSTKSFLPRCRKESTGSTRPPPLECAHPDRRAWTLRFLPCTLYGCRPFQELPCLNPPNTPPPLLPEFLRGLSRTRWGRSRCRRTGTTARRRQGR